MGRMILYLGVINQFCSVIFTKRLLGFPQKLKNCDGFALIL